MKQEKQISLKLLIVFIILLVFAVIISAIIINENKNSLGQERTSFQVDDFSLSFLKIVNHMQNIVHYQ